MAPAAKNQTYPDLPTPGETYGHLKVFFPPNPGQIGK
jgi:hypothetical protein